MRPGTEAELAEFITAANGPLHIRGGATRVACQEGTTLETGGLSGITLYEPGALTMVAGAGTTLTEIEASLTAQRQMLAFEPYDLASVTGASGASTIGGVFASGTSGARRVQAGAARDHLLGVRFVSGSGEIIKNGGRVMKNVTGYDLVKLMAGAHGTLGVLSEVSFKVVPRPETSATLLLSDITLPEAVTHMAASLRSPFDVSGANFAEGTLSIRVEGFAGSVDYRITQLQALLADAGDLKVITGEQSTNHWQGFRNLEHFAKPDRALWHIHCKPSDAAAIANQLPSNADLMADWGGGRIWAGLEPDFDLRAVLPDRVAHSTMLHGAHFPRFHPQSRAIAQLEAAIRTKFDPRGILNPGLMNE